MVSFAIPVFGLDRDSSILLLRLSNIFLASQLSRISTLGKTILLVIAEALVLEEWEITPPLGGMSEAPLA